MNEGSGCQANNGGEHKFKPMMVESIPPSSDAMANVGINEGGDPGDEMSFDADDRVKLILALTTRRYAIVCEACGFFAGGFAGNVKEDEGETT